MIPKALTRREFHRTLLGATAVGASPRGEGAPFQRGCGSEDLAALTLAQASERIRSGAVSPSELVSACLAGRLIRSQLDRGVVVVLDEHLVTKRYGKKFIRSLPYTLKSRRLAHVHHFLEEAA